MLTLMRLIVNVLRAGCVSKFLPSFAGVEALAGQDQSLTG
jgi:hypothetical protein